MLEDFLLRVEFADAVMQQRIFFALLHSRRAADNDDRRFLGECFRGGVCHFQPADAISDADSAEAAYAGVSIRGETGALFVAGVHNAQRTPDKQIVKSEDVIAGHAEDVADAVGVEPLD